MRANLNRRPLFLNFFLILAACGKTTAETETAGSTGETTTTGVTGASSTTGGDTTPTTGTTVTTGTPETTTTDTSGVTGTSATSTTTGDSTSTGPDSTGEPLTSSSSSSGSSSTTEPPDTEGPACVTKMCNGKLWGCGDCIDNDGDGKVDAEDVECVNPCDNDEGSFATGIPGDGMDACKQDCFFDGNSGAGDDKCEWNLKCDPANPGAPKCSFDPNFNCPAQNDTCLEVCKPPTGCDCFGCCSVYFEGDLFDILLGDDDCSIGSFDSCTPCTKTEDCSPEECMPELCKPCLNQPLPPECMEATCEVGEAACVTNADCPGDNEYCAAGCCKPTPQ